MLKSFEPNGPHSHWKTQTRRQEKYFLKLLKSGLSLIFPFPKRTRFSLLSSAGLEPLNWLLPDTLFTTSHHKLLTSSLAPAISHSNSPPVTRKPVGFYGPRQGRQTRSSSKSHYPAAVTTMEVSFYSNMFIPR